jgi:RNA polymerase sigma factor (sigma-70 family)
MANYSQWTDKELVIACRKGDEGAWDTLVSRYERLVYTVPLRYGLTMGEADDVFQSVWLLLLNHLADLRQPERVSAWLVTTARRECWDRRRGADFERSMTMDPDSYTFTEQIEEQTTEDIIAQYERYVGIRRALARLDEACRRLLWHLYFDTSDNSYADVSARLDMPLGSIGPKRARCLKKLRQLLEEH